MSNRKNRVIKRIFHFIVLILMTGYFANHIVEVTYGNIPQNKPNVILTFDNNGHMIQEGNLFGNDLWYPDKKERGIIRINNEFRRMQVTSFGVEVNLEKVKDGYDKEVVYLSFLNHMKLTIEKGRLLIFDHNMVDHRSFGELIYKENDENHKGLVLENTDQFYIDKNDCIDLKYTLYMDEEAGKELQGITAKVKYLINVHENIVINNDHHENDKAAQGVTDIEGHWAKDYIEILLEKGIIQGYPDGTIRPGNYITRAEAAVLMCKTLKLEPVEIMNLEYKDSIPDWARGYIMAATEKEIFNGYPDKEFKPDCYVTREEMTAVLIRAFNIKKQKEIELELIDKDQIATWAKDYVKAAVENKIIEGYPDNTFLPKESITRAEAFTIIYKLLQ